MCRVSDTKLHMYLSIYWFYNNWARAVTFVHILSRKMFCFNVKTVFFPFLYHKFVNLFVQQQFKLITAKYEMAKRCHLDEVNISWQWSYYTQGHFPIVRKWLITSLQIGLHNQWTKKLFCKLQTIFQDETISVNRHLYSLWSTQNIFSSVCHYKTCVLLIETWKMIPS